MTPGAFPTGRAAASRGARPRGRRAAAGFTLLEVLVASALLALLAVIGWRGLEAVLAARDRVNARSDDLRALTVAFSQIDEDLRRSWPVRLMRTQLQRPSLGFSVFDDALSLDLLREGGSALDTTRIERVSYRVRAGRLERGFGPLLALPSADAMTGGPSMIGGFDGTGGIDSTGVSGGTAGGTVGGVGGGVAGGDATGATPSAPSALPLSNAPLVWQPLLVDVAGVQYRAWVRQRGWTDPVTLAAAQASLPSASAVPVTPPAGTGPTPGTPGSAAGAPTAMSPADMAAAALEVTGVEMTLVRGDGTRYVRVFPVVD